MRLVFLVWLAFSHWCWAAEPFNWADYQVVDKEAEKYRGEFREMDWWKACRVWGGEARAKKETRRGVMLREYLAKSGYSNALDLANVAGRKVVPGMTTCGVYAALGDPDDVRYTENFNGRRGMMIYRARAVYVHTHADSAKQGNAMVVSVQY